MTQFRKPSWHQQVRDLTTLANKLNQENRILRYLYTQSVKINKKNLNTMRAKLRDYTQEPEPLEDK